MVCACRTLKDEEEEVTLMQSPDIAAFILSPLGLTLLALLALMALACVLLTVLVVSQGASQRALVARAETANKLLVQIRERLVFTEIQVPAQRKVVGDQRPAEQPRAASEKRVARESRVAPKKASNAGQRTDIFHSVDI